jgi:hypothetical protein
MVAEKALKSSGLPKNYNRKDTASSAAAIPVARHLAMLYATFCSIGRNYTSPI